jgi:hypothetical protein
MIRKRDKGSPKVDNRIVFKPRARVKQATQHGRKPSGGESPRKH